MPPVIPFPVVLQSAALLCLVVETVPEGARAMAVDLKQIASRIRALREIAGVSVETAAREFGIPVETYRQYESGETDMPVTFLTQVADRFDVELTAILTGDEPRLHTYAPVRKGHGVAVQRRAAYDYIDLAYNFADKDVDVFLVTVQPSDSPSPPSLNTHPGQEFEYVLEGTVKITIDGHEVVLEEGDSIYFNARLPHGMVAEGGKPARFIAVVT